MALIKSGGYQRPLEPKNPIPPSQRHNDKNIPEVPMSSLDAVTSSIDSLLRTNKSLMQSVNSLMSSIDALQRTVAAIDHRLDMQEQRFQLLGTKCP